MSKKAYLESIFLALAVAGCSNSQPVGVIPTVPPLSLSPAVLKIGQSFSVKLRSVAELTQSISMPDDGDYTIRVEVADVEYPDFWNSLQGVPIRYGLHPVPLRKEIGVVSVVNGAGEGTFVLRESYDELRLSPGGGIWVSADGKGWKGGVGSPLTP